jgi:carbonic anhydrase
MSCTSNPINLKKSIHKGLTQCKEECSYEFNYSGTSSPIIANAGDYLDINVDSKNNVKFNTINVTVPKTDSVRIYQPSFHLFAGKQADAEIVIIHNNPMGDTLLVCVPITGRDGKGKSNSFFSQIISHAKPTSKDETGVNINVSNWSLNDIVPNAPFYFYIGPFPYKPCNGTANIIVFGMQNTATMDTEDLKKLKSLITPIKYNKRQKIGGAASNKPLVMRNSDGSRGPGSIDNGYYIFDDCETITGMEDVKPDKPVKNSGPAFIWTMVIAILLLAFFGLLVAYCIGTNSTSNHSLPVAKATPIPGS